MNRDNEKLGVDYDVLDPFKRLAQGVASMTDRNIERLGLEVVRESRGESVFLIRRIDGSPPQLWGTVPETLGTKNLVADAVRPLTGRTYYDAIAQDTVAMNVNDLITMGCLPVVVGAHIAAGSSEWFADQERARDLITGWKHACDLSGCVYGPGESPALTDLVASQSAVLSGFGLGLVRRDSHLMSPAKIQVGDSIVCLASSGIHANGLTEARQLAARSDAGYEEVIPDGSMFGEALLTPTSLYSFVIEKCQDAGIDLHYSVNITGHGWRKFMRAARPLRYVIDVLPPSPPPIFEFLTERLGLTSAGAYAKFNMGVGFAIYVAPADAPRVVEAAASAGVTAWSAGSIAESESRSVVITPLGVAYGADTLQIR